MRWSDATALQAWLNEYDVETKSWGLVAGSKSVEVLLAEVKRGETSMAHVGTVNSIVAHIVEHPELLDCTALQRELRDATFKATAEGAAR